VGLTTPVAFYSVMFWEHMPATASILLAIFLVMKGMRIGNRVSFVLAGLAGAIAFAMRTELVFILVGLGITLLFFRWRGGVIFGFSFFFFCIPILYINNRIFGHPITPHLGTFLTQSNFALISNYGLKSFAYFLFNPPVVWTYPIGNISLVLGTVSFIFGVSLAFVRKYRVFMLIGLLGLLILCTRILFSDYGYRSLQGFVLCAPYIMFLPLFFDNWNARKKEFFTWFTLITSILFGAVYIYRAWIGAGGLQWGPRYLLTFYPIFTIMAVVGLEQVIHITRPAIKISFLVGALFAFLIGFGFQVRGYLSVNEVLHFYADSESFLTDLSDHPVVTRYCDPALIYAGKYWEQHIFNATWTGLEAWIDHARSEKIRTFYVINLDICTSKPLHLVQENRLLNPSGLSINRYSFPDYVPDRIPIP
jgi:hypothetical protein